MWGSFPEYHAPLIGVTGGIGAGKSTVLWELQHNFSRRTVDSDDVIHRLYGPGSPVLSKLVGRWGTEVARQDGSVDRSRVAQIVFGESAELDWLERVSHPFVLDEIKRLAVEDSTPLFCGVPLLFERGWDRWFAPVIAVWCDRATQLARLRKRGWTAAEIEQRVSRQWDMDRKLARADFGLINSGTRALLHWQLEQLLSRLGSVPEGEKN
jgi:dephospho-CoA kinase